MDLYCLSGTQLQTEGYTTEFRAYIWKVLGTEWRWSNETISETTAQGCVQRWEETEEGMMSKVTTRVE